MDRPSSSPPLLRSIRAALIAATVVIPTAVVGLLTGPNKPLLQVQV